MLTILFPIVYLAMVLLSLAYSGVEGMASFLWEAFVHDDIGTKANVLS